MQTSQLDQIMRQKDPELLKAVQHLANNETVKGIAMLAEQGRVTEIPNGHDRIAAIARDYAAQPENTIIVSPDNRSRQQINEAVRDELRKVGRLGEDGQMFRTLTHRSDMTGADRTWAARYNAGDVLQYTTGSKAEGIERGSFATVAIRRCPHKHSHRRRWKTAQASPTTRVGLKGVNVFREVEREFATGDRVQFTAPNKDLGVANRDLGTVVSLEDWQDDLANGWQSRAHRAHSIQRSSASSTTATPSPRTVRRASLQAVFSPTSTPIPSRNLINDRLAYVAISRASDDARIFTNDAGTLGERLASNVSKTTAFNPNTAAEISAVPTQTPRAQALEREELGISI